jgi:hypothetical protein
MTNIKTNRVSLSYKNMPASMVAAFIGWIISCMNGNAAFNNPPVPLVLLTVSGPNGPAVADTDVVVDMTTRQASLLAAISAAEAGGTVLTAAKNAALQFALDGLDALAFYVQTVARYDLPLLLTSGFQPVSTNRAQTQLDPPSITGIDNDISTQLAVHLSPIPNAVGYELQTSIAGGEWKSVKFSTQARTIPLTGLTTGTVYNVRARALGGSTGQSDWSIPGSKIVD